MAVVEQKYPQIKDVFFAVALSMFVFLGFEIFIGNTPGKLQLLLLEFLVVLPVITFVLVKRFPFRDVFRLYPTTWSRVFAAILIGAGMKPVFDEINQLIQSVWPMTSEIAGTIEQMMKYETPGEAFILFLAVGPVAGFAEEMLFRGFIQSTLERSGDVTKAVMATALIFTVMHFNPWWLVEILIIGILLGVIAWKCRSILPAVAAHGVYNVIGLFMANKISADLQWYLFGDHVKIIWILIGGSLVFGGFKLIYMFTDVNE